MQGRGWRHLTSWPLLPLLHKNRCGGVTGVTHSGASRAPVSTTMWLDIAVFVGTGVLSTLVAQILIYAGAGDPWTCFLPFFNYFGAALVGLLATNRHRPRRNGRRQPIPLALASPSSKVGKVLTPSAKNGGGVLGAAAAVAAFAAAAAERVIGLSSSASPNASSAGGATASGVDDHGHGSGAGGPGESAGDNTSDDDSPRGSASSAGDVSGSGHAAHLHRTHSPDPLPWLTESRFIAASVALDAVGFLFTVGGIGLAGSALFQASMERGRGGGRGFPSRGGSSAAPSLPPPPLADCCCCRCATAASSCGRPSGRACCWAPASTGCRWRAWPSCCWA